MSDMQKERWARFGKDVAEAVNAKDQVKLSQVLEDFAKYLIVELQLKGVTLHEVKYELAIQIRDQIQGQIDGLKLMWLDFELSAPEGE